MREKVEESLRPTRADWFSCVSFQRPAKAAPEMLNRRARLVQRADARRSDSIEAARTAGTNRRSRAKLRADQAFVLQAFERRLYRTGSDVASEAHSDFLKNCPAIGVISQPDD